MTITQAKHVPLVAVIGATGIQGTSVIEALSESGKGYRVRGFSRDITKAAAEAVEKLGVEMVEINLVVENKEAVYKAFAGTNYAFWVTNFWEHMSPETELSEGKMLVDAANAAGVKGIIWSGLPPVKKISSGKNTNVVHCDNKTLIAEYGRASGIPFVDIQAGFYASNLPDGTYALTCPVKPTTVFPVIDMENDYGLYVRRVLEMSVFPDGLELYTGEDITAEEMARQLSQVTERKVIFKQITTEDFTKNFAAVGVPLGVATDAAAGFWEFCNEFGYYGGRSTISSREGLARTSRTFAEFAKGVAWSMVLAALK
ncbi:NAD(P)-binding protein [Mycena olivaceomarginata]|nr:NAD(P)-binding protein [Mycena olivaceomarginata]